MLNEAKQFLRFAQHDKVGLERGNLRMRVKAVANYLLLAAVFVVIGFFTPRASAQTSWSFVCGTGKLPANATRLTAANLYSSSTSSGFDLGMLPSSFTSTSCTGEKPFFFSLAVPEGNYQVTLVLGDKQAASVTTVKAESRRLMVDKAQTAPGKFRKIEFTVNVRYPEVNQSEMVRLKPREKGGNLDWDHKLTLEFNGDHPSVRSISIKKVDNAITVFLAGDSTVVDQDKEPWAAWGQMLPCFFGPKVAIANNAESGETIRSFVTENRLDKVLSTMKRGDYLFIQFGHNDQKPGRGYVPAFTDFENYLRRYISEARKRGGNPVLVTPMNRRRFDAQGHIVQTLGDYPEAMRRVAAEQKVPLIDLNAMSKTLFETLGVEGTLKAFVHYPAHTFPDQDKPLADNTHFNAYGAYELARCVVQGIRDDHIPLAKYLRKNAGTFDSAHPDPVNTWSLPASPEVSTATPYER